MQVRTYGTDRKSFRLRKIRPPLRTCLNPSLTSGNPAVLGNFLMRNGISSRGGHTHTHIHTHRIELKKSLGTPSIFSLINPRRTGYGTIFISENGTHSEFNPRTRNNPRPVRHFKITYERQQIVTYMQTDRKAQVPDP